MNIFRSIFNNPNPTFFTPTETSISETSSIDTTNTTDSIRTTDTVGNTESTTSHTLEGEQPLNQLKEIVKNNFARYAEFKSERAKMNVRNFSSPELRPNQEAAIDSLCSFIDAYLELRGEKPDDTEMLQKISNKIARLESEISLGKSGADTLKSIKSKFQKCVQKSCTGKDRIAKGKEFRTAVHIARGKIIPKSLEATHTITLESGQTVGFKEKTTQLDSSYSLQYLKSCKDLVKEDKINEKAEHPYRNNTTIDQTIGHINDGGQRLSPLKKEMQCQGSIINGHEHSVEVDGKTTTILRSGAFAVHGLKPHKAGISVLKKVSEMNEGPEKTSRMKELGFDTVEDLLGHLELRTQLAVAQAMPKIVRSLELMSSNETSLATAIATGSFLHVEESLLSDLDPHERVMIEDMKGAIDYIRQFATIQFGEKPETNISVTDNHGIPSITFTLPTPEMLKGQKPKDGLRLTALFFNTGINEQQTIGKVKGLNPIQNEINTESEKKLLAYVNKAQAKDIRVLSAGEFGEYTKQSKDFRDVRGLELRSRVISELGGTKGVACKSGKDRTALEVSRELTSHVSTEKLTKKDKEQTRRMLLGGLSLEITGQNIGKNGYAINDFQRQFFPKGLEPIKRLCGSGPS